MHCYIHHSSIFFLLSFFCEPQPANKQSCSKTTTFPFSMAKDHTGPGYYCYSSGVSNRLHHKTLAKTYSKNLTCRGENTLMQQEIDKLIKKGGHSSPRFQSNGVLQSFISSAKERGLISRSH